MKNFVEKSKHHGAAWRKSSMSLLVREAKRSLANILLEFSNDELTSNEIEILYLLSKDDDIHEILNKGS